MHFLADESCDFNAVRSLRADGHDVLAVSEFQRRSVDQEVMEIALRKASGFTRGDLDPIPGLRAGFAR